MKKTIDILKIVPKERFYCKVKNDLIHILNQKLTNADRKKLIKNLQISRKTLNRILHKEDYWINLETLFKIIKIFKIPYNQLKCNINMIKTKDSAPIKKTEITLTNEFYRITGHLLSDGGIHIREDEGKYRVFYVNNEKVLLESFFSDIKSVFGECKIYTRERENRGNEIWLPTTLGLILYQIFNMYKSKERIVPYFIFELNKLNISTFLQSVFDDEGYLYPEKKIIGISLKNKRLLSGIQILMKSLEINTNPIHVHKSKNRSKMFYFNITGHENLLNFNNTVNFLHPVKKRKLVELLSSYGG